MLPFVSRRLAKLWISRFGITMVKSGNHLAVALRNKLIQQRKKMCRLTTLPLPAHKAREALTYGRIYTLQTVAHLKKNPHCIPKPALQDSQRLFLSQNKLANQAATDS